MGTVPHAFLGTVPIFDHLCTFKARFLILLVFAWWWGQSPTVNVGGLSPIKTMKRGENMEQWLSVIGEVGFPIVVTLYLLNRIESKLDALNHSIQMLPSQLGRL